MGNLIQSTLFLMLAFPLPAHLTRTVRLEAESLSSSHETRCRVTASGSHTVYSVQPGEQLIFPVCLYRDVLADIIVRYSNDGDSDVLLVRVDGEVKGSITTVAESRGGFNWEVIRNATAASKVLLTQGLHRLTVEFSRLDQYGVEIDCIDVVVYDDFINEMAFNCSLLMGADPPMTGRRQGRAGYVEQRGYRTTCPEENNVLLPVYHDHLDSYTIKATNTQSCGCEEDYEEADDSACPNLQYTYWQVEDVRSDFSVSTASTTGNVTVANTRLTEVNYTNDITITFNLGGLRAGFIDEDFCSVLTLTFAPAAGSTAIVKLSYVARNGTVLTLDELSSSSSVSRTWNLPEMTWTETRENIIYLYTKGSVTIQMMKLVRGDMKPTEATVVFSNDIITLTGFTVDFWRRRPPEEYLTLQIGDKLYTNFSYFALYVSVPWQGNGSFQELCVVYQDGNVHLLPPSPYSTGDGQWSPVGTSVLIGRSNPADERPAAPIRTISFYPEALRMALTYYDGSSCSITLTYSPDETVLTVANLRFNPRTRGPFATFRSMFVEFGEADADSIQSERQGPYHVLDNWTRMYGNDFMIYRKVKSCHNSQGPDIRLTITPSGDN